ncbi:hypothetical protein ACHAWF_010792 [Thalassiosira exigua]
MNGGNSASMVRYVDHTYRDFSRYVQEGGDLPKHKKCDRNFPARVHQMLSDPANSRAVTWMPHGRAWKIIDKELLVSEVLVNYKITCTKYESFSRQLNAWGFKRLYQSGPDLGCYYHENFLRDIPELTWLILRLPANLGKATPYPAGEPNFYRISERFPLPPPPPPGTGGTSNAANDSSEVRSGRDSTAGGADDASCLSLMRQQWQRQAQASAPGYPAPAPAPRAQFVPPYGQSLGWGGNDAYAQTQHFQPTMPSQALQFNQAQVATSLHQQQLRQQYGNNFTFPPSNAGCVNPMASSFDFRFDQAAGQGGGDLNLEPAPYMG